MDAIESPSAIDSFHWVDSIQPAMEVMEKPVQATLSKKENL